MTARTGLVFLFFIGLFCSTCSKGEFEIPEYIPLEIVDLGTHKLELLNYGDGDHTIVFENGLGTQMTIWVEPGVFEAIGKNNQVIAYNRGGYGNSEVGPTPRDIPRIISELHQVIEAKAKNEKVILVGHSLGGAFIRSYAIAHPEKVEALLFIESTHEDFLTLIPEDEAELIREIKRANPNRPGTIEEAMQMIENDEYLESLPNLPDVPTITMVSTRLDEGLTEAYINRWVMIQESLGEGLSDFTVITTNNSGHKIHEDEPQLVIDAISDLINK